MAVLPRDVVRIWDVYTVPSKTKLHICVCQVRRWFLRINSSPAFRPNHPLLARDNRFLDHNSYVELQQLVEHRAEAIEEAEHLGRLDDDAVAALCEAVKQCRTLSADHKDFIIEKLTGRGDP